MNDTILLIAAMALTMLLWSRIHYWTQRAQQAEAALVRAEVDIAFSKAERLAKTRAALLASGQCDHGCGEEDA